VFNFLPVHQRRYFQCKWNPVSSSISIERHESQTDRQTDVHPTSLFVKLWIKSGLSWLQTVCVH
jgi:hypothetical protein